jgi:hypothetical protein
MLARMPSMCLSLTLLDILAVSHNFSRARYNVLIILGPAMENHTLMHHTLGTGEFGYVPCAVGFRSTSLMLCAACTTPW